MRVASIDIDDPHFIETIENMVGRLFGRHDGGIDANLRMLRNFVR